jgi:hypothetical protein
MIKKKKTAALFEVIAKQQQQVQVPGWFRRNRDILVPAAARPSVRLKQPPGLQSSSATALADVEEETLGLPLPPPPAAPLPMRVPMPTIQRPGAPGAAPQVSVPVVKPSTPVQMPAPAQVAERVTRIIGGRLRLSLGYPACLAAALALLVVLFSLYKLGQFSGTRSTPPSASAAANPIVANNSTSERFSFDAAQAKGTARYNSDRRFVLVERNVTSQADAQTVCEYLWSWGYVPVALQDEKKAIVVCAMTPEVGATADSLQKAAAQIRELGKKPAWKLRGQYSFASAQTMEKKP